jgi:hypothetical protein
MALTITPANVLAATGSRLTHGTAGATITAGKPVYRDAADGKYKVCNNFSTADKAVCAGIALHGASSGQPLAIASEAGSNLNLGATLTVGEVYVLAGTAGEIDTPNGFDLASQYVTVFGVASTTSNLVLNINSSGVIYAG